VGAVALPERSPAITVIRPSHGWRAVNLADLWRYRELVYFLAWRDVKVRYKQTFFGVLWAVLQPVAAMAIFTVFLGQLARVPSDGVPYALFAYAGLLPWAYFASATVAATGSLVSNTSLISKIYFPRLVIPIAAVLGGLIDLAIGAVLLIPLLLVFGTAPTISIVLAPAYVALAVLIALGVGIWLSALDVQYRDVRYAIPLLMQLWLFATPVVYPASLAPAEYRPLLGLNPVAGAIEGFRWSLLGTGDPPGTMLLISVVTAVIILVTGIAYFRRMERAFADVI
jgi:lipopolysaccharide transport system permease protein